MNKCQECGYNIKEDEWRLELTDINDNVEGYVCLSCYYGIMNERRGGKIE